MNFKLIKNTLSRLKINLIGLAILSIFPLSLFTNITTENKEYVAIFIIGNPVLCFLIPVVTSISLFYFMFFKTANDFYNQAPISKINHLNSLVFTGFTIICTFSIVFFVFGMILNFDLSYNLNFFFKSLILQTIIFLTISVVINHCKNFLGVFLSTIVLFLVIPYMVFSLSTTYFLNIFEICVDFISKTYFPHYLRLEQNIFNLVISLLTIIMLYLIIKKTVLKRKLDANVTPFYFETYSYFIWFLIIFCSLLISVSLFSSEYNVEQTYLIVSIKRVIIMVIVGTTIYGIINFIFYKNLLNSLKTYLFFVIVTITVFIVLESLPNKLESLLEKNDGVYIQSSYLIYAKKTGHGSYFNSVKGKVFSNESLNHDSNVIINNQKTKDEINSLLKINMKNSGIFSFNNQKINVNNNFFSGTSNSNSSVYSNVVIIENNKISKIFVLNNNKHKDFSDTLINDQFLGLYENTNKIEGNSFEGTTEEFIISKNFFEDLEKIIQDSKVNYSEVIYENGGSSSFNKNKYNFDNVIIVKVNDVDLIFRIDEKSYKLLTKYKK